MITTIRISSANIYVLCMIRPVSMDSVTARFHIPTRHQDWNKTIYEITPVMKHFTWLFPKRSKAFHCCKMIRSHTRWWSGPQWGFHPVSPRGKQRPRSFTMLKLHRSLTYSFHAKSIVLFTWRSNKCAWHSGESSSETIPTAKKVTIYGCAASHRGVDWAGVIMMHPSCLMEIEQKLLMDILASYICLSVRSVCRGEDISCPKLSQISFNICRWF